MTWKPDGQKSMQAIGLQNWLIEKFSLKPGNTTAAVAKTETITKLLRHFKVKRVVYLWK